MNKSPLFLLLAIAFPGLGLAQREAARDEAAPTQPEIEEVVVTGRFLSAAESLAAERITVPFSTDFLGADVIARAGDPDIASALRRVPGLTVVDGKFVYVRGLGERYSSVTVNDAAVPSPELTRSVIPLDLFPTSIVESIRIQKSPSPDRPASFGGGAIDIRTTSVPSGMVFDAQIGLGVNNRSAGDGLTFPGEATPMPAAIRSAIDTYLGDISVASIFGSLRGNDASATVAEARAIHQSLIDSLNTNIGTSVESLDPDVDGKLAIGNIWHIGGDWQFGALLNATANEKFRNENQRREGIGNPEVNFVDIDRTVREKRTVASANLGLKYAADHSVEFAAHQLNNDEALASFSRGFDQNNEYPDQKLNYSTRTEQRGLTLAQVSGEHAFLDTPVLSGLMEALNLRDLEFDWFFSESQATTGIPNESDFQAGALLDTATGQPISTQLLATTSSGQFSFLDLDDNQSSWGGDVRLPLELQRMFIEVSAGWWGAKKDRDYRGYNINLNSVGVRSSVLSGAPGDVLVPGRLTVENGFDLSLGTQFGTESYVGAQKVDAVYGMLDVQFNGYWRATLGGRHEAYQQAVLPIDLLDYTPWSSTRSRERLRAPDQRLVIKEDDIHGSAALTYDGSGLLGTDRYQVRLSYGETVVRPDLREVADVVYIDPELNVRVRGNPALLSSPIANIELRTEFFWASGDNFTVSLFHKDIQSPIEQIRQAGSDDDVVLGFANAESGRISGVEFEGLKELPGGFFLTGNMTASDSEINLDPNLSTVLTNLTRRMTGHSEWVVNATLGYDSDNGMHSAYLNYNAFGERIYFAGTGRNGDAYEQPFDSLGVVYKHFPTDNIEIQVKADNLLDEDRLFEQANSNGDVARIISQKVGTSFSLSGKWFF